MAVKGEVLRRALATVNPAIATGEIEVRADEIRVLSESKTPPFELTDETRASEDLRLKYRYLDIRRGEMRRRLEIRSRLTFAVRRYLIDGLTPDLLDALIAINEVAQSRLADDPTCPTEDPCDT